jgi:hypothetical protein
MAKRLNANPALARALACLAHPGFIAAACVLLVNALWLQAAYPSWLTGKLGDVAWLLVTPCLLALPLSLLVPVQWRRQVQVVGLLALLLAGLPFALVKTAPAANLAASRLFGVLTGLPPKLRLDPGDLLALPALGAAAWLWARRPAAGAGRSTPARAWRVLPGMGLAALALLADAPDRFVFAPTCLGQNGPALYSFTRVRGELIGTTWNAYRSDDGGLTWQRYLTQDRDPSPTEEITAQNAATPGILQTIEAQHAANAVERAILSQLVAACADHQGFWEYAPPGRPDLRYRFYPGQAIDRSNDGGRTWQQDLELSGSAKVPDARFDPVSGNLVVIETDNATRIRVRKPDGTWTSGAVTYRLYGEPDLTATPQSDPTASPLSPIATS